MNVNFKISPGNAQNIGSREQQQDAFAFSDILDEQSVQKYGAVAVLADGMGGMLHGSEASGVAAACFLSSYRHFRDESLPAEEALQKAIGEANREVFGLAVKKDAVLHMGTTLAAALIENGDLHWVSAGDSRLYVYREQYLTRQTQDHNYGNYLQQKVENGLMTVEEAEKETEKHALYSFLGMEELPDICRNNAPVHLKDGDKILLCSDGMYNALDDFEICGCLTYPAQEAADMLLQAVLSKQIPNQDNVTVMIMEYNSEETEDKNIEC